MAFFLILSYNSNNINIMVKNKTNIFIIIKKICDIINKIEFIQNELLKL